MIKKVVVIFLNLLILGSSSSLAKKAPSNTFKLTDSKTDANIHAQIHVIRDKLDKLQNQPEQNILIEKINEFRISRLEKDLEELRK